MPSLSKLYKSAKNTFKSKQNHQQQQQRKASNDSLNKSVRFSTSSEFIYYTHSSVEYDRKSSSIKYDDIIRHEADSLKSSTLDVEDLFDEEVIRNTRVNKKQGHYSIAALVSYRANI